MKNVTQNEQSQFQAFTKFVFDMNAPRERTSEVVAWAAQAATDWFNQSSEARKFQSFAAFVQNQFEENDVDSASAARFAVFASKAQASFFDAANFRVKMARF